MSTISDTDLLEALNWRYATKKFDATRRIPAATWETLRNAAKSTP